MLYDLTAIDERVRVHRPGQPESAFTVVYHLLSYGRNADIRVKVPLREERLSLPSIVGLWPSANWYEREVWDMFGIAFEGHPEPEAHPFAAPLEGPPPSERLSRQGHGGGGLPAAGRAAGDGAGGPSHQARRIRREAGRDPIPISCSSTSDLTTPARTAYSA